MLNDFRKNDFWVLHEDNNDTYHLRVNSKWIKVTKDVYSVYKNSYQKAYRDQIRETDTLTYYENADDFYPYIHDKTENNIMDKITEKETKRLIQQIVLKLSEEEQRIILAIYFEDITERELAKELHMSQQKLHYRKMRTLKKLRNFLSKGNKPFSLG